MIRGAVFHSMQSRRSVINFVSPLLPQVLFQGAAGAPRLGRHGEVLFHAALRARAKRERKGNPIDERGRQIPHRLSRTRSRR